MPRNTPGISPAHPPDAAPAAPAARRWLLLAHQLPARNSNLRVRIWRRLQQVGAIAVKQGLYALPETPATREDFEWLTAEVTSGGGDANLFVASAADAAASEQLVEQFRRARQDDYHRLARELERELKRPDPSLRRAGRQPRRRPALDAWRQRLTAIERIDFFASAGRDRVVTLLGQLEARGPGRRPEAVPGDQFDATRYRQRLWVTRPRPGVDRMASAWLIRRFIDPDARFGFIADQASVDGDMVPFDMFGVEFTHRGEACTFETLVALFGIHDDAAGQLAAIVHDLDLNDHRFDPAEAGTVRMLIDGLQQTYAADEELLEHGIVLFETLYRSMSSARTRTGPTPVAARRGARRRPGGTPRSR